MHITRDGVETPGWISTLETENPVDFEMGNHFTATHPESLFRNRIMASAVTPDGRVNIMNRDVTVLMGGGARHLSCLTARRCVRCSPSVSASIFPEVGNVAGAERAGMGVT